MVLDNRLVPLFACLLANVEWSHAFVPGFALAGMKGKLSPKLRIGESTDGDVKRTRVQGSKRNSNSKGIRMESTTSSAVQADSDFVFAPPNVHVGPHFGNTFPSAALESTLKSFTLQEKLMQLKVELIPWGLEAIIALGISLMFHDETPLVVTSAAEVCFLTLCIHTWIGLNKIKPDHEPQHRDHLQLWEACLSSAPCPREFIRGWFFDAKFEDITREDVESFIVWGMFDTTYELLSDVSRDKVQIMLEAAEHKIGRRFPHRAPHHTPLRAMRFSLEPVSWFHKPLLFYAATTSLNLFGDSRLRAMGFSQLTPVDRRLPAWVRLPATAEARARTPIVFVHGVGVGPVSYTSFLTAMDELDAPLVVVELPHVSMRLDARPRTAAETVDGLTALLDRLGYPRAVMAGHSFGSLPVSWIAQRAPDRVAGAFFIDPVTFQLHLCNVVKGFLYRTPNAQAEVADLVMSELMVNYHIRRGFYWRGCICFPEDFQRAGIPTVLALSELDPIVPSAAVAAAVARHAEAAAAAGEAATVDSYWMEGASHGQAFTDPTSLAGLAARFRAFYRQVTQVQAAAQHDPASVSNLAPQVRANRPDGAALGRGGEESAVDRRLSGAPPRMPALAASQSDGGGVRKGRRRALARGWVRGAVSKLGGERGREALAAWDSLRNLRRLLN